MKRKIKIEKFKIRITTCYKILFVWKHWFIAPISEQQLRDYFMDKDVEFTFTKHGLQNYNVFAIIKGIANQKDDIDMALMKADFEAQAQITYGE